MLLADMLQAILVPVLLGIQAVVLKIGLRELPPIFMVGMRFALMLLVLLPFLPRICQKWRPAVAVGLTQGVINHAFLYLGLQRTDVSAGMIVYQANVVFSLLLGYFLLKERLKFGQIIGVVTAVVGVALVIGIPKGDAATTGLLLVLVAALAFACGNVIARKYGPMEQWGLNAAVASVSAPLLMLLSGFTDTQVAERVAVASWTAWAALSYTAFIGGTLGFVMWYRLLNRYSVDRVAPFSLLMPVFAMAGGVIFLGEQLTVLRCAGAVIAISGVAIAQFAKRGTAQKNAAVNTPSLKAAR